MLQGHGCCCGIRCLQRNSTVCLWSKVQGRKINKIKTLGKKNVCISQTWEKTHITANTGWEDFRGLLMNWWAALLDTDISDPKGECSIHNQRFSMSLFRLPEFLSRSLPLCLSCPIRKLLSPHFAVTTSCSIASLLRWRRVLKWSCRTYQTSLCALFNSSLLLALHC